LRRAAAVAVVALLAGCGSSPTFAERGNAICREAKQPGVGAAGYARLEALDPPPELRAERNRFFRDVAALAALAPIATPAKRDKASVLIDRLPDEARALGWTDCAG
jgi:hypothetical protein